MKALMVVELMVEELMVEELMVHLAGARIGNELHVCGGPRPNVERGVHRAATYQRGNT